MTQHWEYDYAAGHYAATKREDAESGARANVPPAAEIFRLDAAREVLAQQVTAAVADRDALLAQRAELICEVETMRARLGAWRECARQGVRLVEHITVTQSTDGQWPAIAKLYDTYDDLFDAEITTVDNVEDRCNLMVEQQSMTAQHARRKANR